MNVRRPTLLIAAGIAALSLAPAAQAEPVQNSTLTAAAPEFKWEGAVNASVIGDKALDAAVPCGAGHYCEEILLKTESAGKIAVAISSSDPNAVDLDLYLHESDASGKKGKQLGASETFSPNDAVSATAKAGAYYLALVDYRTCAGCTYAGVATLKPSAAPAAAVTAPVTTAPATPAAPANAAPKAAITKLAKKVKASKLKGFTGTASDDAGVAKVEVAVTKGKAAPAFKAAKGTSSWSFKLGKKLKKGTYTVHVRATDAAGLTTVVTQTFKVA